jgi:hypothetical protein
MILIYLGNAQNGGKIRALLATTFVYVQVNRASLALFDGFIKAVNENGLYAEATRRSLDSLSYYMCAFR